MTDREKVRENNSIDSGQCMQTANSHNTINARNSILVNDTNERQIFDKEKHDKKSSPNSIR